MGFVRPEGLINFNWKLITTPLKVIDYVVVHEFASNRKKSLGAILE